MDTTYIDIVLEGNKFSPKLLRELTNFDIETLAEYGEIGQKGRYKGTKMPYGLALLKVPHTSFEDINSALKKIVDDLLIKKALLSRSGVDEITLDLENFSRNEVEITIDREIIRKISALNASIDISSVSNFQGSWHFDTSLNDDNRFRNQDKHLLNEIYFFIQSDKQFNFSQSEKLKSLFKEKINSKEILPIRISSVVLMSAMIVYILKYIQEDDFDKIPSFDKVLKENYSE